jgi:hypothetical protein
VGGFNLFETFVAQRLDECANYLNAGHVQFLDLPEKLQRNSILNTVRVANFRLRRPDEDLDALRAFSREVGSSLAAVDRSLQLSAMAWLWDGSNMAANNYAGILRQFHIFEPWRTGSLLADRLGFGQADLEDALTDLVRERHNCAHEALYGVTALWLRSIPNRILLLASVFDILISLACVQLRSGDTAFLENEGWLTNARVGLRFVRERAKGAAEIVEGRSRASRVLTDADQLFRDAVARCSSGEALVRQDHRGQVLTWTVPSIG